MPEGERNARDRAPSPAVKWDVAVTPSRAVASVTVTATLELPEGSTVCLQPASQLGLEKEIERLLGEFLISRVLPHDRPLG